MSDWDDVEDPVERVHAFASGFHATFYVYTGVETGLFEALIRPRTPAELTVDLGLHGPYVRRFCEVGLRWGLLVADSDGDDVQFRLAKPFVEPLGTPNSHRYVGEYVRFLCEHLTEDYRAYPNAFATGETHSPTERGPSYTEVISGSTRGLVAVFVVKLLRQLTAFESALSRGGRILDVGCGTGELACQLLVRYPDIEVVGVDVDADAIDRARDRAQRRDVADRATFRVRDATEIEGSFDAAVFFMSLHEIDPGTRERLFEHLGECLKAHGVVAAFDPVYPERVGEFDREPYAEGVETQWAELVWGVEVPTRERQRALLAAAGCTERERQTFAGRFEAFDASKDR